MEADLHNSSEQFANELTFGQWIRRLRGAQDLTQERLAEGVPCAVQTIRSFESGARRPSLEMAERLADILNISAAERPHFLALARRPAGMTAPIAPVTVATPPIAAPVPAPAAAPPPADSPARPKLPLTALIGRAAECAELRTLLVDQQARLVSLVGPGGIGKSRLALQMAHDLAAHYQHGALWIALAPVDQADGIPLLLAEALDVTPDGALAPAAQLDALVAGRQVLLVLDNFEHLLDGRDGDAAVALLDHLLNHNEGVHALITTRERLRLSAEHVFELDGLSAPAAAHLATLTLDDLANFDAVMLFLERARQIDRQFALNRDNYVAVAEVCALLRGMPLAIELAAAWVRLLSPHEIAAEISQSIDFLAMSDRTMAPRHRSMRAVFDHSWTLLQPEERTALARLAIFRSGFARDAAQAVAGLNLPMLAALVDKSLVRSIATEPLLAGGRINRYDLHELLRQYLGDKLAAAGEEQEIAARHARHYTSLAAAIAPNLTQSENRRWVVQLDAEQGNLTAALQWCLDMGNDRGLGVQLAAALGRYWYLTDQWREGRTWLSKALLAAEDQPLARAHIVARLAEICLSLSDLAAAQCYFEQAIALWRQLDEQEQLAWTLFQAGSLATATGNENEAEGFFAESLALYRSVDNRQRVAMVLMHRCSYVITHGHYAEAAAMAAECLPIFRETGFFGSLSAALNLLGRAVLGLGDFDRAVALFNESLDMSRERNSQSGRAWSLLNLGLACTLHGDIAAGRRYYADALEDYLSLDRRGGVLAVADGLAAGLAAGERAADAVALMAATDRLRAQIGESLTVQEVAMRADALAAAHTQLSEEAWARAWQRGLALTFDQVVALARK